MGLEIEVVELYESCAVSGGRFLGNRAARSVTICVVQFRFVRCQYLRLRSVSQADRCLGHYGASLISCRDERVLG